MKTFRYAITAVVAALTIAPTAAAASTPDHRAYVTAHEYDRAAWGDCRADVERRFDTVGREAFTGTIYTTRWYPTPAATGEQVAVVYQRFAGCWRLVEKRREQW